LIPDPGHHLRPVSGGLSPPPIQTHAKTASNPSTR
jgi:hypothetical protein